MMLSWVSSIFNSQDVGSGDDDKYGLQMSLTLSTHPFLNEYRDSVREFNQDTSGYISFTDSNVFVCEIPKGRHNYPTIIVRSNESKNAIHVLICRMRSFDDEERRVIEALADTTYYGQTVYIKSEKCREADPVLFKPFKFEPKYSVSMTTFGKIFWNVPMIFIGFDYNKHQNIYEMFLDILNSNPIGKDISSIEFLDYMSQPVVFWIKTKEELREKRDYHSLKRGLPNLTNDLLEYKILGNITVNDKIFKMLRESYLETMGRRLLDPSGNSRYMSLEPK